MSGERAVETLVRIRPELRLSVVERAGQREPSFLLVHGLASNARLWDPLASVLAGAGHRVVAVDLRGHRHSDKPDDGYDSATIAADLDLLATAVRLDQPVLVGQSWGGNVVLTAAALHPDRWRGVVAVDGGTIDLRRAHPEWEEAVAALQPPPLTGIAATSIAGHIRGRHPDWPEEGIRGLLASFRDRGDGTVEPWLTLDRHLSILRGMWEDGTADFEHVSVGVLLLPVHGGTQAWERMKRRGVEEALARLPRARAVWLDGDHDVHAQRPEVVAGAIFAAVADGLLSPPRLRHGVQAGGEVGPESDGRQ